MAHILTVALLLISTHVSATPKEWEWIPLDEATVTNGAEPTTIKGNTILQYKNAGEGGIDWVATGEGRRGGWEVTEELWLLDDKSPDGKSLGTSEASTAFSVTSNAVSFMIAGDSNDGFAQFFVDDENIGTFDLYQEERKSRSLVVTGLNASMHSLKIVQLGRHRLEASKGDVAIFGGAAFNTAINPDNDIPEPNTLSLMLIFLLTFFVNRFSNKGMSRSSLIPETAQTRVKFSYI